MSPSPVPESVPRREWRGTDHHERVPGEVDRVPPFDPRTGDHLWTIVTMYRVNPELMDDPTHTPFLDTETLISVVGPGCFYCSQPYTKRIAKLRCRGHG